MAKAAGTAEFSTTEAKRRLSELLRRVHAGEHITITRYGEPVATLRPPARRAPDLSVFRAEKGRIQESAVDTLRRIRDEERY